MPDQIIMVDMSGEQVTGMAIRLAMLMTHYRQPINWTEQRLAEAATVLRRWYPLIEPTEDDPEPEFLAALANDLNTPQAIAVMHGYAKRREGRKLYAAMRLLGFLPDNGPV